MKKGETNNPNGRPAGSPNVITAEMRNVLQAVVSKQIEDLPKHLKQLSDEKKVDALIRLLPFILPKVESVQLENELSPEHQIQTIRLIEVRKP